MTNLMQVRERCILLWPSTFPGQDRRGGPGYVVDLDAPLEAEWCAGQMHKLAPAPEGAKAATLDHPVAARRLADYIRANGSAQKAAAPTAPTAPKPAVKAPTSDDELEVRPARKAGAA